MNIDERVGWGEWIAQGVGVFCVVICLLAFFPGWEMVGKIFADKDAPAWVQAIGSIGAILVAVVVANLQFKASAEKDAKAEAKKAAEEKAVAIYLLNTFGGALLTVQKKLDRDIISLWDARTMNAVLKAELNNVQAMPILALSLKSRKTFFGYRLIAIQYIEAIDFASRSVIQSGKNGVVVNDVATRTLRRVILEMHPKLKELTADLEKNGI